MDDRKSENDAYWNAQYSKRLEHESKMTTIQQRALWEISKRNAGAVNIPGEGWIWPADIRGQDAESSRLAKVIVEFYKDK